MTADLKGLMCWDVDGVLIRHSLESGLDWRKEFADEQALELYTLFEGQDMRWRACLRGEMDVRSALTAKASEMGLDKGLVAHVLRVWHGRNTHWHHENLTLIARMKQAGWKIAIASNQDKDRAKLLRQALWLEDIVDVWGFSCHLGEAKPEEDFFHQLRRMAGAENMRCVMIDDVSGNLVAPAQLGWETHFYTQTERLKDFLLNLG